MQKSILIVENLTRGCLLLLRFYQSLSKWSWSKKEFTITAFSSIEEIFMVYITTFSFNPDIYFYYKAQLASIFADNISIAVSSKYDDFIDVFFLEFAI